MLCTLKVFRDTSVYAGTFDSKQRSDIIGRVFRDDVFFIIKEYTCAPKKQMYRYAEHARGITSAYIVYKDGCGWVHYYSDFEAFTYL